MDSTDAALVRCVGDLERFSEAWGRRPLLHEGGVPFDDLLSLADVDRLVSSSGLRTPSIRLVRDGRTLEPGSYTRAARTGGATVTGLVDPAKLHRRFAEGATIVLQGMHRFWPPLASFCRDLEWALGHSTQVNAYVTPAGARGLAVHEDSHDVFVLQSFGTKRWRVWSPGTAADHAREGRAEPEIEVTLRPGGALYIPRGTPHAAEAQVAASGHLTVGILATRWGDVVRRALTRVEPEAGLGLPVPLALHRDTAAFAAAAEDALKALRGALERLDGEELARAETRRFLTSRPALLAGGLVDAVALGALNDETELRRRPGSICMLEGDDGELRVLLGDRELRMPARLRPAMEQVAAASALRPRDLAPHLDGDGRLVLARRLVREGLLEVAGDG